MATVRGAIAVDTEADRDRQVMDRWTYYRLHNDEGSVIGFMRTDFTTCHYVDLRSRQWRVQPIEYFDCVRLAGPLPGFAYLEEPD